jgi:carbonic anhydrase
MPQNEAYLALQGALDHEFQSSLSPKDAFHLLKSGHDRFINHITHRRSRGNLLADAATGQFPYAAVLGCIDSRVPVEELFDAAFGDMFVARIAGNAINNDVLGSLEYACKYAGSKIILVLGHTLCGAINGAWSGLKDGHVTGLLHHLQPAIDEVRAERGSDDDEKCVSRCIESNVHLACRRIRQESSILRQMEQEGAIAIIGAVYDVATGEVHFNDIPSSIG